LNEKELVLEVSELTVNYGATSALKSVDLFAHKGEIVGLAGPNGAGKTTLLETIAGFLRQKEGDIRLFGTQINEFPVLKRRMMGVVLVPQERNNFPYMTVSENLDVGGIINCKDVNKRLIEEVYQLFPVLHTRANQLAGTMSGGEQRMLAIGIGLVSNASILLIDEPSTGLAPKMVTRLFETLGSIKELTGKTIVLSEQNIGVIDIADRVFGIEAGEVRFCEKTEDLDRDIIRDLYLGK
jgi:ABC-type branched-subunit amino acid transport system ATPase component